MGIFTKNKEKMDILQKTQENLELTQKNLSLLAAQNQESISENQEVLQRTLTSIEAMLGKKNESVPCKKEYSPEEKKRAAYALNCCTISVSQIVDYDDIYVLEQEYESILNNLNLENMPKDEALLDIYKQLLDTITFFRIQEGDKAMLEKEYQDKVKNAIWSAVPSISLAGLATNPIGAAINLATQVGIGYMNYRREKAAIQSEQEKQKWQLTRSAMEQFNGLRRELFTTAWRLADRYDFADNLRITEQQITVFNKILLETDDLKRYERLDYIKDGFEAYTPFLYYLGNAAYKASQKMCEEDAAKYREIAQKNYDDYIENTKNAKLNLFRQDHIRAACALELFELNGKQECDVYLLDMAKDAAGSNFDVLEICALHYMQFEKTKDIAKKILRMLVNENYNAVVNGQILSSIYVSEYIKSSDETDDRNQSRHNYETLSDRINSAYLFPLPDTPSPEQAKILEAEFLKKQKVSLLQNFNSVLKEIVERYTIKFNRAIFVANQPEVDAQWYFSDDPKAIDRRIKESERAFSQNNTAQYIRDLGFAISDMLDILNELCITMEDFPYSDGNEFVHNILFNIKVHKNNWEAIMDKVKADNFTKEDLPLLFKKRFSDLTHDAFLKTFDEIWSKIIDLPRMEDISGAEAQLRKFCIQQELNVPILTLNNAHSATNSRSKARYVSLDMLDMDAEDLKEEIDRVREMKTIIDNYIKEHPLVKPKEKGGMIVLMDKAAKFEIYRRNYLSEKHLAQHYGEPLLVICSDNAKIKNDVKDLVFTSKGIEYFRHGEWFKPWEKPWELIHCFPIKYTNVKRENDGVHIGKRTIKFISETINAENLHELIKMLEPKQEVNKLSKNENDNHDSVKSSLVDELDDAFTKYLSENCEVSVGVEEPTDADGINNVSVEGNRENCGCIHLNKVINEKNSYGEWDIEGTVTSGTIEVGELCYVEDTEYRVNHITRLDNNQPASKALCGQTAKFSLYKMR